MANFKYHTNCEECGSSDGKAIYDDLSSHCFACQHTVPSKEYIEENQNSKPKVAIRSSAFVAEKVEVKERKVSKALITEKEHDEIKSETGFEAHDYRGISDDVLRFYGCRTKLSVDDEVLERYYPTTIDGKIAGYKVREHPKQFRSIGNVGNECDLYGSFRFTVGGKYLLITEGEEDCHAAFQMLKSYTDYKGWPMCAVVSITNGGANPAKQLANNYEFINQFENIILGLDNDTVGKEAIEKCISALPKGKVKIASWKFKDPNEYLQSGNSQKFINDFYSAKTYVPAGVLGSDQLYDRMLNQAKVEKVPFPPLFKELNYLFNGGMSLGYIYNIAADTGIGKTSLVNELIYYWIFNSPHLIGVVSMELSDAQYAEVLYSRHIQRKLALMDDDAKLEFLGHDDSREKGDFLFKREDGSPRFFLCEDRDASLEQLQETIEQMVISSGVKVVVLDPLQDVLDGLSNEEQATFMKWAKSMIKSHGISFVFINHKRKSQANTPGGMDEADIHGSSTIIKSAGANILLARDKMAEDMRVRNTTRIQVSKNRITGLTGPAGAVYYDNETHTMHNYEDFFGEQFVMPQK